MLARDIRGRYRSSALGSWWVALRPILELLPYFVLFGVFLNLRPGSLPYVLYMFSGFAPWLLFRGCVSAAPNILAKMRSLITKVYFPRMIAPLNTLILNCIDFAVVLALVVALSLAMGVWPLQHWWALPLYMLLLLLFTLGAGLLVTVVCAAQNDFSYGVPAALRVLFYASPIVYPAGIVPAWMIDWYLLNPMTTIISGIRWSFYGIEQPSMLAVAIAVASTAGLFLGGLSSFLRIERRLADVL
jgi:lipopolysaccharide transport system permease protein